MNIYDTYIKLVNGGHNSTIGGHYFLKAHGLVGFFWYNPALARSSASAKNDLYLRKFHSSLWKMAQLYGFYMDFTWIFHGLYMDFTWIYRMKNVVISHSSS